MKNNYAAVLALVCCAMCLFFYDKSLLHKSNSFQSDRTTAPTVACDAPITSKELTLKTKLVADRYAVFTCDTPDGKSHRQYDYAFYLPLTVLAWDRIGFKSIVIIVGRRIEWSAHPLLSHILLHLEAAQANIIFLNATDDNGRMLSQTARLFAANMKELAHKNEEYLITSDSVLWPFREAHYTPEPLKKLILVHSHCCGSFPFRNRSYRMIPMSNIGATAATWREIMNDNRPIAHDAESILNYYQQDFGPKVRQKVVYASDDWYLDQKMVSIRVQQWIDSHSSDLVFEKSDANFSRIDRPNWNLDGLDQFTLRNYYDAHLPVNGYVPHVWKTIRPLIHSMYNNSWQISWCESYATEFFLNCEKRNNNTQRKLVAIIPGSN